MIVVVLIFLLLGLVYIAKGGDYFVQSAVQIARKLKISPLVIGATLVSVGTTLPEMTVSIMSVIQGESELAVSNALGSMFCNLALILGVVFTFSILKLNIKNFVVKIILSILNGVLLIIFVSNGKLEIYEAIILFVLFAVFIISNLIEAKKNKVEEFEPIQQENQLIGLTFLVSVLAIGIGAKLLIDNAVILAEVFLGIPESVIGATIVAFGTSVPELVTAISSIKNNCASLSFGNILGANIINGTLLISICTFINGGLGIINFADIFVTVALFFVSMLIMALPVLIKKNTQRWQGISLLVVYLIYIVYLIIRIA